MFEYQPDPKSPPPVEKMLGPDPKSLPKAAAAEWTGTDADLQARYDDLFDAEAGPSGPVTTRDLVTSFDKDKTPWQYRKYSAENSLWQSAALRRRAHPRRTNTSLGVCSCDLSGPHVATPRPGNHTHKNPCYYFLVLAVRPDLTAATCDSGTQTDPGPVIIAPEPTRKEKPVPALVYAALLGSKDEASDAIKKLLVQINNDHANFPTEIIFRFHSDQGGEFMSKELQEYLTNHGIMNHNSWL